MEGQCMISRNFYFVIWEFLVSHKQGQKSDITCYVYSINN